MLVTLSWLETAIAERPPIVTVRVAVPVTVPDAPVIVVCPGPTPFANPEPLIVATLGVPLLQKTLFSAFCDPSLKVPTAAICIVLPV